MKSLKEKILSENQELKIGSKVNAKLPTGKTISGKVSDILKNGKYISVIDDETKKSYGVSPDDIVIIPKERKERKKRTYDNSYKLKQLYAERRRIELDMEAELAELGDDMYDGNNPLVKRYARMLDNIDKKIEKLS